jgi:hypothetical protein
VPLSAAVSHQPPHSSRHNRHAHSKCDRNVICIAVKSFTRGKLRGNPGLRSDQQHPGCRRPDMARKRSAAGTGAEQSFVQQLAQTLLASSPHVDPQVTNARC